MAAFARFQINHEQVTVTDRVEFALQYACEVQTVFEIGLGRDMFWAGCNSGSTDPRPSHPAAVFTCRASTGWPSHLCAPPRRC
jgi:hypothetical protein